MTLECVECGEPVGEINDKNVPTRCKPCQDNRDHGPTVGEVLDGAQQFQEIEGDALLRD